MTKQKRTIKTPANFEKRVDEATKLIESGDAGRKQFLDRLLKKGGCSQAYYDAEVAKLKL